MARTTSSIPTAAELIAMCDLGGAGTVAARLGITRRQAEQVELAARRALALGVELQPGSVPAGTARRAAARHVPTVEPAAAVADPGPSPREVLAWLQDPAATAEQKASAVAEARRQEVYRRNVKAGHPEWRSLLVGEVDGEG
jgi:hypothetical protein